MGDGQPRFLCRPIFLVGQNIGPSLARYMPITMLENEFLQRLQLAPICFENLWIPLWLEF